MTLEAQHLVVDAVGSNWAKVAGRQQSGVFRQFGYLVLVADQQGQFLQRRGHPGRLMGQAITVRAHPPTLFGALGLAA
ncbi:hypothetical protein FQZ97_1092920 [compost metagenome]